jgi:PAS domain S-box-containing protein
MERRISSIQAHVNAVERHVNAIKQFQDSQTLLRSARRRLHHQQEFLAKSFSGKEYAEMLEELPLPAFFVDRDVPCFIAANTQFCKLLGYPQAELMGMSLLKALADAAIPMAEKALREDPPQHSIKWPFKQRDGTELSLLTRYRRISLLCCGKKLTNVSYVTVIKWHGEPEIDAVKYFGP